MPFRVVLVQLQTWYIFVLTLDVGSTVPRASLRSVAPLHTPLRWGVAFLRATAGKRPFRSFSFSAFLVHFVKTKKIETGLLSCLYFLGSPSWTRTNDIVINSHALYRLSYWGISNCLLLHKAKASTSLSSQDVSIQVFSALLSLTSVFGMGTGGT